VRRPPSGRGSESILERFGLGIYSDFSFRGHDHMTLHGETKYDGNSKCTKIGRLQRGSLHEVDRSHWRTAAAGRIDAR
jgi:hypothetical protein